MDGFKLIEKFLGLWLLIVELSKIVLYYNAPMACVPDSGAMLVASSSAFQAVIKELMRGCQPEWSHWIAFA